MQCSDVKAIRRERADRKCAKENRLRDLKFANFPINCVNYGCSRKSAMVGTLVQWQLSTEVQTYHRSRGISPTQ